MDTEQLVTEAVKKYLIKLDRHVLRPTDVTFVMLNFDEYDIALLALELEDQFGIALSDDDIDDVHHAQFHAARSKKAS